MAVEIPRDERLETCTDACERVLVLDIKTRRLVSRVLHDAPGHEDAGAEYGWTWAGRWEYAGVMVDLDRHEATIDGEPISPTPIEMRILALLTRLRGAVASDELLLARVWGPGYEPSVAGSGARGDPNRHLLRVHMRRLRAKLRDERVGGSNSHPIYRRIRTVPTVGYALRNDDAAH